MNFIELTNENGDRMLLDFDSGWQILDMGRDASARWVNNAQGRNLYANDNYESLRARLALTNPMLTEGKPAAPDDPAWYEKLEFAPPADPAPDETSARTFKLDDRGLFCANCGRSHACHIVIRSDGVRNACDPL